MTVRAAASAVAKDQVDFDAKAGADLEFRYTKAEAEQLVGEQLLKLAIASGWVIPEYNGGQLVAVRAPTRAACDVLVGLAIVPGTLDTATIELRKGTDPVKRCSISGDLAALLDLGERVRQIVNVALNAIPQGLLKVRLAELFPEHDGVKPIDDLLARMPIVQAMRPRIVLGSSQCTNGASPEGLPDWEPLLAAEPHLQYVVPGSIGGTKALSTGRLFSASTLLSRRPPHLQRRAQPHDGRGMGPSAVRNPAKRRRKSSRSWIVVCPPPDPPPACRDGAW